MGFKDRLSEFKRWADDMDERVGQHPAFRAACIALTVAVFGVGMRADIILPQCPYHNADGIRARDTQPGQPLFYRDDCQVTHDGETTENLTPGEAIELIRELIANNNNI